MIGSFPTAFLLGRYLKKIDVIKEGTGNVGAMNAYEVSGSPLLGIAVGIIDAAKGATAVLLFGQGILFRSGTGQAMLILSTLSVVTGHNYSVFIGFKGGRGLATSAGAMLFVQPLSVAIFVAVYFILRLAHFRLYLSSTVGVVVGFIPVFWKFATSLPAELLSVALVVVLVSKHIVPLKAELLGTRVS